MYGIIIDIIFLIWILYLYSNYFGYNNYFNFNYCIRSNKKNNLINIKNNAKNNTDEWKFQNNIIFHTHMYIERLSKF